MEVHDKKAKAFLREHFLQCLFSGIFGGDVKDQSDCSESTIQIMLTRLWNSATRVKPGKWPQDERWETDVGEALKEWALYDGWGEEDGEEDD